MTVDDCKCVGIAVEAAAVGAAAVAAAVGSSQVGGGAGLGHVGPCFYGSDQETYTIKHWLLLTMAKKKNRTVTSFAHKSFENPPSVLKFLLKLPF